MSIYLFWTAVMRLIDAHIIAFIVGFLLACSER